MKSLNQLAAVRTLVLGVRCKWLRWRHGVDIAPGSTISLSGRIICGQRGAISIGPETLVAFKTLLTAVDTDGSIRPIRIGRRCFIGGGAMIRPGVTIGDESIVGAGAVVFDDVPPRSIVGGVPARILRSDIVVGPRGRLAGADENSRRLWK